ncbi:hypothetical protein ACVWY3_002770 [Bradyrhizobium sp. USDA 4486]
MVPPTIFRKVRARATKAALPQSRLPTGALRPLADHDAVGMRGDLRRRHAERDRGVEKAGAIEMNGNPVRPPERMNSHHALILAKGMMGLSV